jgi:hypothetical protein
MSFAGNAQHQAEDLVIHCDEADLMIRDYRVWIARGNDVRPLEPLEPTSDPATAFIDILDGTQPNPAPFAVARPVWDLTAMILDSARRQQVVRAAATLPPRSRQ